MFRKQAKRVRASDCNEIQARTRLRLGRGPAYRRGVHYVGESTGTSDSLQAAYANEMVNIAGLNPANQSRRLAIWWGREISGPVARRRLEVKLGRRRITVSKK